MCRCLGPEATAQTASGDGQFFPSARHGEAMNMGNHVNDPLGYLHTDYSRDSQRDPMHPWWTNDE